MRVDEATDLVKALNDQDVGVKFKVVRSAKGVGSLTVRAVNMVERVNIMSGKTYVEDEDTPCYMSPASESYWSM